MGNELDRQYKELLETIINFGVDKTDRTGTGTKSVFGYTIRHNMQKGFPILTTKKVAWKQVTSELLWFLTGQTNISFLLKHNNHIWDGDAWANYQRKTLEKFMDDSAIAGYAITNKEEFINKIKTDDEFAKKWGDLGPIYGKQWRSWGSNVVDDLDNVYTNEVDYDIQNGRLPNGSSNRKFVIDEIKKHNPRIDQITNLINELKTNPDSRRLMVSAWNVGELDQMVLPPCHYGFQCWTRELSLDERAKLHPNPDMFYDIYGTFTIQNSIEDSNMTIEDREWLHGKLDEAGIPKRAISLMWNQRSVDTFLGLPFNIASYGLLLHLLANECGMIPDELIGNLGDTHLYLNHIEQAKEQIGRTPYELPTLKTDVKIDGICCANPSDFVLEGYQYHPTIKAPLSN